jgi:hypothetical protein
MESARAPIQHRRMPRKPEHVHRRATKGGLAFRLSHTVLPAFRRKRE